MPEIDILLLAIALFLHYSERESFRAFCKGHFLQNARRPFSAVRSKAGGANAFAS